MFTKTSTLPAETSADALAIGEVGLMATAACIGACAGYLILSDFTFTTNSLRAKGAPIATVLESTNIVKRRPAGQPRGS